MGPTSKKNIKAKWMDGRIEGRRGYREDFNFFFSISFFLRFTDIRLSEFVGPRKKSALRDEGYSWVPKTRDFTENSGKKFEKS